MNRETFTKKENWYGSYYELCLELGPKGDDERLLRALNSLWAHPQLHGSWTDRDDFQTSPPLTKIVGEVELPRHGILTLGHGLQVGCESIVVRESDDNGADWLDLCIPTGMLGLVYSVDYPLSSATNPWMHEVNQILASIGSSVFQSVPFRLGLIGEEASGIFNADSISADDLRRSAVFLLPETLKSSLSTNIQSITMLPGLVAVGLQSNK